MILDTNDKIADTCFAFISEAFQNGDSTLIHSIKGQNRSCTILASWIIRRYRWTLNKALEFLRSRKPELKIRQAFIKQLVEYERRLNARGLGPRTSKWNEINEETNDFENEELLIRNTYLNAQMGPFADYSKKVKGRKPKIKWVDHLKTKKPLATIISSDTNKPKSTDDLSTPIKEGTRNFKKVVRDVVSDPVRPFKKTYEDNRHISKEFLHNSKKFDHAKDGSIKKIIKSKVKNNKLNGGNNFDNNNDDLINEILTKQSNYIGPITQIINHNNINNYIIQNPENVQVIEHIHKPGVKKVAQKKVSSVRPSSASVRREFGTPTTYIFNY